MQFFSAKPHRNTLYQSTRPSADGSDASSCAKHLADGSWDRSGCGDGSWNNGGGSWNGSAGGDNGNGEPLQICELRWRAAAGLTYSLASQRG